jgi:hypothetical protein
VSVDDRTTSEEELKKLIALMMSGRHSLTFQDFKEEIEKTCSDVFVCVINSFFKVNSLDLFLIASKNSVL